MIEDKSSFVQSRDQRRQRRGTGFSSARPSQSFTGDNGSVISDASDGGNGKLEEDVRFPMGQHLLREGTPANEHRVQELNLLRTLTHPDDVRPVETIAKLQSSAITFTSELGVYSGEDQSRFSFFAAAMDETIHGSSLGMLVKEGESFDSLFNKYSGVWWLDCHDITDMELRVLARAFDLHPLTSEDIMTRDVLEKFDMFKEYGFFAYKTFDDNLDPVGFYIVVLRDGVITFHFGSSNNPNYRPAHCHRVRSRMRKLRDAVKVSSVWICYALIDDITDSFAPVHAEIEEEAAFVEKAVFVDNGTAEIAHLLGRLGQARQKTMSMVRLLYGKPGVITGLIKRCEDTQNTNFVAGAVESSSNTGSDFALYLGDIRNRVETMRENLLANENILSRSHNSYMGILQVEYVNSNTRMTTLLGKVTIIATILVPMNLVFGAWGMNVPVPGGSSTGLGWFFGIVGVICFVVVLLGFLGYWYFEHARKTSRAATFA